MVVIMRRTALLLGLGLLACVRANPAFDELDELGDESGAERGDGDGDGDESVDGDAGDGDGDGDDQGDGDSDDQGDGDGDGDDNGDGDGEPSESESETGDGDGDDDLCTPAPSVQDPPPLLVEGEIAIDVSDAPGFAEQEAGCLRLIVCHADQNSCEANTDPFAILQSGMISTEGQVPELAPIRIAFRSGNPSCAEPVLVLDPYQRVNIAYLEADQTPKTLKVYLPCFEGLELDLWVAADGSSYYDAQLQDLAASKPTP